tara:strand:- start:176 stop:733 length:558 start_codon:yes stop_codon:yes gene_type:complete
MSGVIGQDLLVKSGKGGFPAGHVLQVLTAQVSSGSITVTCTSNDFATVPTLQQAITPSSTSSKILVTVFIGAYNFSSTNYGLAHMGVFQRKIASGSFTDIGAGTGVTNFNGTFSLSQLQNNQYYDGIMAQCIDSPNTTSECTYGIGVADHNNGTQTFYLNRKNGHSDTPSQGAYSSSLTVMEIKG